jgi:hypothetical protein
MNTVTIIVTEKKERRVFGSWKQALESLRWWVILDEAERKFDEFVFGK